jgi:pimeloyl-[acyl-carrier protein] methyl ester esterase
MLGFVFCHGWGYDPSFWDNLKPYFGGHQCIFWDLGYFGPNDLPMPALSSSIQWVGVGHSIGFLKLLNTPFPWYRLIGLQGFLNFQGISHSLKRKRARYLVKLQNHFEAGPTITLSKFHKICGNKDMQAFYPMVNRVTLLKDISLLATMHQLRENLPCLILGSEDDLIVTKELINDNFGQHNQVQILMHNKGSHTLGFSEPTFVKNAIFDFLSDAK